MLALSSLLCCLANAARALAEARSTPVELPGDYHVKSLIRQELG